MAIDESNNQMFHIAVTLVYVESRDTTKANVPMLSNGKENLERKIKKNVEFVLTWQQ